MIQAEVLHPSTLSEGDASAWRALCAVDPALRSPLLGPDFARLVGEVRPDARVAVFRRGGRTIGFLAFHKRPDGFARPIGSAFSDYHALVVAPGEVIDGPEALAAAQISAFGFTGLIDPARAFPQARPSAMTGHVIELNHDAATHQEALRTANPKRYKNWRRLQNKLEREFGEVTFTASDSDQAAFDLLLAWKRDQFHRTGSHDVLRADWARALFQTAFERREGPLRGVMTTLRAGGRLVAGHFGLAQAGVFHAWISSMDPACAGCGPGQVLMLQAPETLQALGLQVYDLGPGYAHYKAPFATGEVAIADGLAMAPGPAGRAARSLDSAWAMAGDGRIEAVCRLRRRLDHIAAAELSTSGRVRGLIEAIAGSGRRAASREPARAEPAPEQA